MGTHPLIIELIKVEVCTYNILHCSSPLLSGSISFYRSESMIGERGVTNTISLAEIRGNYPCPARI